MKRVLDRIGRWLFLKLEPRYGHQPRGTYTAVFDHARGVLRLEPETTSASGATMTFSRPPTEVGEGQ